MSTASFNDGYAAPAGWRERLRRLGHHEVRALAVLLVTAPANVSVKDADGFWQWSLAAAGAVWLAGWALTCFGGGIHARNLCEECIAEFPIDAQAQAEKHARTLRTFHARWWNALFLVGWVAALGLTFLDFRVGDYGWSAGMTLIVLGLPVVTYVNRRHGLLRPACPTCRAEDGDGGPDVSVEPPVPTLSR